MLIVIILAIVLYAGWTGNSAVKNSTSTSGNTPPTISGSNQTGPVHHGAITENWEIRVDGPLNDLVRGDNNTFYAFTGLYGNKIYALDKSGNIKWQYQVPDEWRSVNMVPVFAVDNGTLYLYIRENRSTPFNSFYNMESPGEWPDPRLDDKLWSDLKSRLLAISPEGKLLWEIPVSNVHYQYDDPDITVKNGRIYLFNFYNLTVINKDGSELGKISDVASRAAVDDDGYIYAVTAKQLPFKLYPDYIDPGPLVPADEIRAYYPNGTLYWSAKTPMQVVGTGIWDQNPPGYRLETLPIYQNDTLYVPFANGMQAFNKNGGVKWMKNYGDQKMTLLSSMPVDNQGKVSIYLDEGTVFVKKGGYGFILPDGTDTIFDTTTVANSWQNPYAGDHYFVDHVSAGERYNLERDTLSNGSEIKKIPLGQYQLYAEVYPTEFKNISLYDVGYDVIAAEDPTNPGYHLWNRTFTHNATGAILNRDNEKLLMTPYTSKVFAGNMTCVNNESRLVVEDAVIYASLYDANYEWPIVLNQTRCAYSSNLYVLDANNGNGIWEKSLEYPIAAMIPDNGTLYYATRDGTIARRQVVGQTENSTIAGIDKPVQPAAGVTVQDIGMVAGGVAGGLAVLAIAQYLFKLIGAAGSVSRARDRLGKNENRNSVLEFINRSPGSTLHEIAKEIDMNVGTVRYHLLILGINHRVSTYKADGKYVRYIPNTGTCSADEQVIISLLKRKAIRNTLNLLLERPGLSSSEISRELDMHKSATSRYTKELLIRGIITKHLIADGKSVYSIKPEYLEKISGVIRCGDDNYRSGID